MSELKTEPEKPRLIIAYLDGKFEAGDQFHDWPLHVTFIPWFRGSPTWATELFRRVSADLKACSVRLGQKALGSIEQYGPNKNVPVRGITDPAPLHVTHGMLLPHFHPHLAVDDMRWFGSGYNPHMTINENPDPGLGHVIFINSLSLLQHLGDAGNREKRVLATTRLE